MAKTRTLTLVFFLVAGVAGFSLQYDAHAAACEAILGKWAWFTKGVVTFNPDGTLVHEPGNDGTWECTDAARGKFTLRWRVGSYVNQLALSADGKGLSSTDPSQHFVTAKRMGAGGTAQSAKGASATPVAAPVIMTTQSDSGRQLPKDLPELIHAATPRAREWRRDAIPVSLKFNIERPPTPPCEDQQSPFPSSPPSAGTGRLVTVTTDGAARLSSTSRCVGGRCRCRQSSWTSPRPYALHATTA